MKDEIVALGIIFVFIALFSYNSYVMEAKTERIMALIDRVDESENTDYEKIKKIRSLWEEDKKVLLIMTSHENILNVDECVEMAEECLDAGRPDCAIHLLKKARHHLEDLKEREKIRLDNIF